MCVHLLIYNGRTLSNSACSKLSNTWSKYQQVKMKLIGSISYFQCSFRGFIFRNRHRIFLDFWWRDMIRLLPQDSNEYFIHLFCWSNIEHKNRFPFFLLSWLHYFFFLSFSFSFILSLFLFCSFRRICEILFPP